MKIGLITLGGTIASTKNNIDIATRYTPTQGAIDLLTNLFKKYPSLINKIFKHPIKELGLSNIDINNDKEIHDLINKLFIIKEVFCKNSKDYLLKDIFKVENKLYELNIQHKTNFNIILSGTDNLESLGMGLHLSKRLSNFLSIITGAMHTSDSENADGFSNIYNALLFSKAAYNKNLQGTYLSFNQQFNNIYEIKKKHTRSVDAFNIKKPLATINNKEIIKFNTKPEMEFTKFEFPQDTNGLTKICPIKSQVCIPDFIINSIKEHISKFKVLIIEGTGNGEYHQSLNTIVKQVLKDGKTVIRTSICDGDVDYIAGERTLASCGLSTEKIIVLAAISLAKVNNPIIKSKMGLQNVINEYAELAIESLI